MPTLAGHPSMWAAVAADSGATLVVAADALRLLHMVLTPRSAEGGATGRHPRSFPLGR